MQLTPPQPPSVQPPLAQPPSTPGLGSSVHFKQQWWLWLLGLVAILLIISAVLQTLTPAPPATNSWNGIEPGKTTIDEVNNQLGQPIEQSKGPAGDKFTYRSQYPSAPHVVTADQNGTVRFIREYPELSAEETLEKYQEKLGKPDLELFYGSSQKAHVYLKAGLLLVTPSTTTVVEEKWHFEPTNQSDFMDSWGIGLSAQPEGPEKMSR